MDSIEKFPGEEGREEIGSDKESSKEMSWEEFERNLRVIVEALRTKGYFRLADLFFSDYLPRSLLQKGYNPATRQIELKYVSPLREYVSPVTGEIRKIWITYTLLISLNGITIMEINSFPTIDVNRRIWAVKFNDLLSSHIANKEIEVGGLVYEIMLGQRKWRPASSND